MIIEKKLRKSEIKSKEDKIIDSIEFVEKNIPQDFEDFDNSRLLKSAVYKEIEFSIENLIDICNIINSDLRLGVPEEEDDIINNLEKNKIFDNKTINLIKEMKGFRNILIHKYGDVNDEQAFETIKEGLKDFELIISKIEEFLKKN